eukprot:g23620.t1
MIAYMQDSGIDTCLISLDQEKAFDRISHASMWDMVSKMGFGEGIHSGSDCSTPTPTDYLKVLGIWFGGAGVCTNSWEECITKVKLTKKVHNITLILMATFVCSCIKLCVDPWMGLALLPGNAPSSWTVPSHLSFVEKFGKENTFDHKSIRKW